MLGRIAKGVGGVAKGVGGIAKGVAGALGEARVAALTAVPDEESEVETLLQRVSDALLAEYRREAIAQLKDLLQDNPKAQIAVGNMGLPVLLNVLREDRDDMDLVHGALESLVAATGSSAGHNGPASAEAHAGAMNADLLSKQPGAIGLLLALLEDEPVGINDFYVRYFTVQLLTALLNNCPARMQESILSTPMSVARLGELLSEREALRNEALLLLGALSRGSSEAQKMLAFEGAFDRLLSIIREEGGLEGGEVVQDCFELLNGLLRGNVANQRLFREMGHAAALPGLLNQALAQPGVNTQAAAAGGQQGEGAHSATNAAAAAAAGGLLAMAGQQGAQALARVGMQGLGAAAAITRNKVANTLCALETVHLMVCPPSAISSNSTHSFHSTESARQAEAWEQERAARAAGQAKVQAVGMAALLARLALEDGGCSSRAVRMQALRCLGDLVCGYAAGQTALADVRVQAGGTEVPALQVVLRVALYASDARERAGAAHVLACQAASSPAISINTTTNTPASASNLPDIAIASSSGSGSGASSLADVLLSGCGPLAGLALDGTLAHSSFGLDLVRGLLGGSVPQPPPGATPSDVPSPLTISGRASSLLGRLLATPSTSINSSASTALAEGASSSSPYNPPGQVGQGASQAGVSTPASMTGAAIGAAKERLLGMPLEMPAPGTPPELLMGRTLRTLQDALRACSGSASSGMHASPSSNSLHATTAGGGRMGSASSNAATVVKQVLVLLVRWLFECPAAVAALLECASSLPLLVDITLGRAGDAAGSESPGLAAVVLGVCLLHGQGAPGRGGQQHAIHASSSPNVHEELVLDVIMSRIGLSQYFARIEDLRRSPSFISACAQLGPPPPLTRTLLAALVSEDAAASAALHDDHAHDAAGTLIANGHASVHANARVAGMWPGESPYDSDLSALLGGLVERVKGRTMDMFSRPAANTAAGSVPEPQGPDDTSRLAHARELLRGLAGEMGTLRARNAALAADLFRLSQGMSSLPPTDSLSVDGAAAMAAGAAAGYGQLQQNTTSALQGGPMGLSSAAGGGGGGPMAAAAAAGTMADIEQRVAAELRANRAEMEAASLKHQVEMLSARLSQAEADAHAARHAAHSATSCAGKAEADLADLSGAYNTLEAHAYNLEAQVRDLTNKLTAAQAQAHTNGIMSQGPFQQPGLPSTSGGGAAGGAAAGGHIGGGVSESEIEARIAAAVAEAQAAAEADSEESMTDLLICLGQEERKVAMLSQRLAACGVDVSALILALEAEEAEDEGAGEDGIM